MSSQDTICWDATRKSLSCKFYITWSDTISGQLASAPRDSDAQCMQWRATEAELHQDNAEGLPESARWNGGTQSANERRKSGHLDRQAARQVITIIVIGSWWFKVSVKARSGREYHREHQWIESHRWWNGSSEKEWHPKTRGRASWANPSDVFQNLLRVERWEDDRRSDRWENSVSWKRSIHQ